MKDLFFIVKYLFGGVFFFILMIFIYEPTNDYLLAAMIFFHTYFITKRMIHLFI